MDCKHNHYFKDVSQFNTIDVYRVLQLFNVTDPCLQHAVKKLLVAGGRGVKDIGKDVQEAIDTLLRFQEMQVEGVNPDIFLHPGVKMYAEIHALEDGPAVAVTEVINNTELPKPIPCSHVFGSHECGYAPGPQAKWECCSKTFEACLEHGCTERFNGTP